MPDPNNNLPGLLGIPEFEEVDQFGDPVDPERNHNKFADDGPAEWATEPKPKTKPESKPESKTEPRGAWRPCRV